MKKKKILALFLSVLMLLGCFPVSASSVEEKPSLDTESQLTTNGDLGLSSEYATQTQEFVSDEIIGNVEEIVSLREEGVKHFRLSDGSYEAVSFASAVHRKDKSGAWKDINNNLTLVRDGEKQGYFTEDERTSFASYFDYGTEIFSISENGYKISMVPISTGKITGATEKATPVVKNSTRKASTTVFDSVESAIQAIQIDNRVSIVYNDIRKNVDIEYVLDGNNVKENIIVKAKAQDYEYAFRLDLAGLTAELDQGGGILIRDTKTEEIKYTIPAPFMYDGNKGYSYDVHYELKSVSEGKYTLKVIASAEWINSEGRKFPVTIDPTIQGTIWVDTYVDSQTPNVSYASSNVLYAGQTKIALIKPYIPSLPLNIISIDSAELYFSYYGVNESFVVGVYDAVGMIDANTTYNNRPSIASNKTAQKAVYANNGATASVPKTVSVPITTLFRNWFYSATIAYGVAIKYYSGSETGIVSIASAETSHAPYMRVGYIQQIPDGVYAIKNVEHSTWMTVEQGSGMAGRYIRHKEAEVSPASSFDNSSLFKISGSDGLYIIRLMTNNNLTLDASGVEVRTKTIPSRDEDVQDEDKFSIVRDGVSFYIIPYNTDNAIFTLAQKDDPLCVLERTSDDRRKWTFEQYTGNHQSGVKIESPATWVSRGIVNGTSGTAKMFGWSTYIDANVLNVEVGYGCEEIGRISWSRANSEATITAKAPGRLSIEAKFFRNNTNVCMTELDLVIIPEEGTYYIQNVDTGRYADIDAGSSQVGAIIHQWHFHTENQIKWNVEHVEGEGGYIRLKSARSNLYLGVDSANTSNVRQCAINGNTLWMIDRTDTGNITLTNKATSGTDKVLAVPLNENLNGTDLTQISYTDDDNYRDEWEMYVVLPSKVKVEVLYDYAYNDRYPDAQGRIVEEMTMLQEKYLTEFGLLIEYSTPMLFSSYGDECSTEFDEMCIHAENEMCFNSDTKRQEEMEELHHKNFYNILARIPFPNTNLTLKTVFVGHDICTANRDQNGVLISHNSNSLFGIAYTDSGLSMITNFQGKEKEIKTLIHEFGHHYNVEDHYGGSTKSTQEIDPTGELGYSRDCIWGENKESDHVIDNYMICDGCRRIIEDNIEKYNH